MRLSWGCDNFPDCLEYKTITPHFYKFDPASENTTQYRCKILQNKLLILSDLLLILSATCGLHNKGCIADRDHNSEHLSPFSFNIYHQQHHCKTARIKLTVNLTILTDRGWLGNLKIKTNSAQLGCSLAIIQ